MLQRVYKLIRSVSSKNFSNMVTSSLPDFSSRSSYWLPRSIALITLISTLGVSVECVANREFLTVPDKLS